MSNPIAIPPDDARAGEGHDDWVSASRFNLPADLMGQARRRLGLLALVFFGLCVVLYPIAVLSFAAFEPVVGISVASTALGSFAIFAASRSTRFSDSTVLLLGLAYEVLLCLSANTDMGTFQRTEGAPGLTYASVIIVVFPLVVPSRPALTLVTSLIAAGTAPLGLYVMHWASALGPPAMPQVIEVSLGPLASVVLATLGSRVIYDLGAELVRARKLGSYTLQEVLGSGGMGEVWRARHEMLTRPAAIKLIKPATMSSDPAAARALVQRFELEAQATASLRSPHTIQLYDFGTSPEGTFYYVMELLDGIDLQELVVSHGPLPARRAVYLLLQVCHSLHEAHGIGLVHRDIKPSNIFVGRYGADADFVKVLDFGLVKHAGPRHRDLEPNLTQKGSFVGTPAFVAPEMVLDDPHIDARVDIYALGCVAYWLLTGAHVFSSKSATEAVIQHARDQPEPPSSRAELSIPGALDALVLSCLEKDPDKRPGSASVLSERLRAVELEPWSEHDAWKWWEMTYPRAIPP